MDSNWGQETDSWIRDKVLYCSQNSEQHEHQHTHIIPLAPKPHGRICNGPRWHLNTDWVATKEKFKSPGFLKKQWQASLPNPESRQLHDSHVMVTLTYSVVCATSYRNCSVSGDGEASQSGMLGKDMQGHSGSWKICLFWQPTLVYIHCLPFVSMFFFPTIKCKKKGVCVWMFTLWQLCADKLAFTNLCHLIPIKIIGT